ncbi:MAG TPA: hypothetical protein VFY20_02585, partial [Gemmatimonadales bacterium]|nr:hypothetical protein [Gemmatimonadales bacterium]
VSVDPVGSNALAFSVLCAGGAIRVTVTTTGRDRDFDGYVVTGTTVGFTNTVRVGPASTGVVGSFPVGATVQVTLGDLAPNCTATGAPFSVTVVLNDPVNLAVPVTCAAAPSSAILVGTASGNGIFRYFPGAPGTFQSIGTGEEPRWAPGGTGFAFVDGGLLKLADVDAGTIRSLDGSGSAPAYSPDPRRLLFLQFDCFFGCYFPNEIYYVDPASPTFAPAVALPAPDVTAFDVSPTTGAVAYISGNQGIAFEAYELRTANADGSGVRVLLTGRNPGGPDLKPRFSPNGQELFLQRECPTGSQPCIYIVRTDGTPPRVLDVRFRPLDWSPDGTRLLVVNATSPGVALSLISATTGQVVETLGNAPAQVLSATWRR